MIFYSYYFRQATLMVMLVVTIMVFIMVKSMKMIGLSFGGC